MKDAGYRKNKYPLSILEMGNSRKENRKTTGITTCLLNDFLFRAS
jgi:hypothetical protein